MVLDMKAEAPFDLERPAGVWVWTWSDCEDCCCYRVKGGYARLCSLSADDIGAAILKLALLSGHTKTDDDSPLAAGYAEEWPFVKALEFWPNGKCPLLALVDGEADVIDRWDIGE